jgi:hypothetical protein
LTDLPPRELSAGILGDLGQECAPNVRRASQRGARGCHGAKESPSNSARVLFRRRLPARPGSRSACPAERASR